MRIAIVSDYFLDYVGGAQTSMLAQRAALEAAGHQVLMVAPRRGARAVARTARELALPAPFTLPVLDLPVIRNTPSIRSLLAAEFSKRAIEVVHVQTEFGLAHAATTVGYERGIPVVHTVHTFYWQSTGVLPILAAPLLTPVLRSVTRAPIGDTPLAPRPPDSILRNLTLAMARRADVVVSPSTHQARDLESALLGRPVVVVPNPADAPATPPARVPDTVPRLVWVARCEPEKRPLIFAEAVIAALSRTTAPFEVDMVGDGSEFQRLKALVAPHPQIRLHGRLPHDAVLELIDASSVVAISSLGFDNQPMTIAEAVSRHRGVLYCDPALSEGLERAGMLSTTPDSAGLADSIVELVTSRERIEALANGAAADAAEFSPQRFVERILAAYQRAAAESR